MIRVTIDRIVLDGVAVSPAERADLRESVASELAMLMRSAGTLSGPAGGGAVPLVDGGTMASEGKLAARIARSVHGAMGCGAPAAKAAPEKRGGSTR